MTLNVMALDVLNTKDSITGTVNMEITLEDVVSNVDIAVLAPTSCTAYACLTERNCISLLICIAY